jgi:hypothetical protein
MIQALGLNARLDGVGSSGRARGLLQKPPEVALGRQGWLQVIRARKKVSEV